MTKQEREVYLEERGWFYRWIGRESWINLNFPTPKFHTPLGAFMRQQAEDARRERREEGR